eukprot:TRINITY_DN4141_c0_g1_i2.p1 TRINITY_DN4141_c0_g1~~TRINITY_DN4141_c0_g1_i2.p1  ORF type:complete len:329 (+),score=117.16 TRINITY_DN4141_c0_g1_i2:115-1101(+)
MKRREITLNENQSSKRTKFEWNFKESSAEWNRNRSGICVEDLPFEMLLRIFYLLDRRDIFQCQTVCKMWMEAGEDKGLWRHLYFNRLRLDVEWTIKNSSSLPPSWRFNSGEFTTKNAKKESTSLLPKEEDMKENVQFDAKLEEESEIYVNEINWKNKYKEGLRMGIRMAVTHLQKQFKSEQSYLGKLVHKKHQCTAIKDDFSNQKRALETQLQSQSNLKKSLIMSCGWAPSTIVSMFKSHTSSEIAGMSLTTKTIKIDQLQTEEEDTKKKLSQVEYLLSSFVNCSQKVEDDIQSTRGKIFEINRSNRVLSQRLLRLEDPQDSSTKVTD